MIELQPFNKLAAVLLMLYTLAHLLAAVSLVMTAPMHYCLPCLRCWPYG